MAILPVRQARCPPKTSRYVTRIYVTINHGLIVEPEPGPTTRRTRPFGPAHGGRAVPGRGHDHPAGAGVADPRTAPPSAPRGPDRLLRLRASRPAANHPEPAIRRV